MNYHDFDFQDDIFCYLNSSETKCKKEEGILIPNFRIAVRDKKLIYDDDSSSVLNIKDFNIKAEIEWFEKYYQEQIEVMRKVLDSKNVELCWGTINYFI
jgi:rhamnose utilization protein RhaD (predicted bifunctional aldolase and dehydrogenase)